MPGPALRCTWSGTSFATGSFLPDHALGGDAVFHAVIS
jgi:hypothetical protein